MMKPRSWITILATLAAVAACEKNTDETPQIRVVPGAADRVHLIDSKWRQAELEKATPSRVHPMKKGEELGGPNAIGKPGDLILENDFVAFVIDQMGSSAGFAESGGNIVDAADAKIRKDELGQLFSYFGTFPRQAVYESLKSGSEPGGVAWVEATGRDLLEKTLRVTTTYRLAATDRALLIQTEIENTGTTAQVLPGLGDAIQWGGAEKFAPGLASGFHGKSSGPFIGGVGKLVSYAITSDDGTIRGFSGGSWSDTEQRKNISIPAHEKVQYARVFLVGARADTASLISELTLTAGGVTGSIDLSFVDSKGVRVAPSTEMLVVMERVKPTMDGGAPIEGSLTIRASEKGAIADVPPGRYRIRYANGAGRRGDASLDGIEVFADRTTSATLKVSEPGFVSVDCHEITKRFEDVSPSELVSSPASPCKITIMGLGGTPNPDFGPPHAAGPAKNQVTSGTGVVERLPLAPGAYEFLISRGPEYELHRIPLQLAINGEAHLQAGLRRVVDTKGYVASDFHQHTMLGADAATGLRDRVISNVAEGVEVAVASEHNVVVDLGPVVRELGLAKYLVEIPGNELTTDASKKPWGHANVYPLTPDPSKPRGGATVVKDRPAHEVFEEIRKNTPGPFVIQINHPRTGITGYFDQLHFDRKTGRGLDPDYDENFDSLEVWNGRNTESRDSVLSDYYAILKSGHPLTPTADTDTHGIVGQEAGYPRTYVRMDKDDGFESWDKSRSSDFVRGVRDLRDVVLTNGPFIRVTAGTVTAGGIAKAKAGSITLAVHVESAHWVDLTEARVLCEGKEFTEEKAQPIAVADLPSGAHGADLTFEIKLAKDAACMVFVRGQRSLEPVLAAPKGDKKDEVLPFAMTSPIWIDVDGDGSSLGRTPLKK